MTSQKYSLTITPEALQFITEKGHSDFQDAYVLVLADLHCVGGIIVPEILPIERMFDNPHYQELFPRDYQNYPFPIYIDAQMESEGYLPNQMLISFEERAGKSRLVFKNPKFES